MTRNGFIRYLKLTMLVYKHALTVFCFVALSYFISQHYSKEHSQQKTVLFIYLTCNMLNKNSGVACLKHYIVQVGLINKLMLNTNIWFSKQNRMEFG